MGINKIVCWLPTIVWMVLIFYLSGQPAGDLKRTFPFIKNLNFGHYIEYFILGLLALYSFNKSGAKRPYLNALILASIYGVLDEFHQSFVPTRHASYYDVMRDFTGAALGLFAAHLRQVFLKKRVFAEQDSSDDIINNLTRIRK